MWYVLMMWLVPSCWQISETDTPGKFTHIYSIYSKSEICVLVLKIRDGQTCNMKVKLALIDKFMWKVKVAHVVCADVVTGSSLLAKVGD